MNKVILVGNITKDPELSTTPSGVSVCRLTVAVSRKFKNADGEIETDFINIVVWRQQAENCQKYLKKGSKVGIVGSMQVRSFEDKSGAKRYITEVIAEEVEFLSTKQFDSVEKEEPKSFKGRQAVMEEISDDDLPF